MEEPPNKRMRSPSEEILFPAPSPEPMEHGQDYHAEIVNFSGPCPVEEDSILENLENISSQSTVSNKDDYIDFIDPIIPEEPSSVKYGPTVLVQRSHNSVVPEAEQESMEIDEDDTIAEPIPIGLTPQAEHPFTGKYEERNEELPQKPAKKIAASESLAGIQKFREETLRQMLVPTEKTKGTNGVPKDVLKTVNTPNPNGVLYVLLESAGNGTHMIPLHKEVVANDRPDLFMIQMTQKSTDTLNEGPPCMRDFYPGDLVYVFSLQRRPDATLENLKKDFTALLDPKEHTFWNVKEFCLIHRSITPNRLLLIQDANTHMRSASCVAAGVNQLVRAPANLLKRTNVPRKNGILTWATIFHPPFNAGQLLRGIRPGDGKHFVTQETECQPVIAPFPPVVTDLRTVNSDDVDIIRACPEIYTKMELSDPVASEVLVTTAHFGLSAALALENKDRDYRTYATKIDASRETRRGTVVTFAITKPSGPPSLTSWSRNVSFKMELSDGVRLDMEVDNATEESSTVVVTARPAHSSRNRVPRCNELIGQNIVVFQPVENNLHQLRAMPKFKQFQSIDRNSPAMLLVRALAGGSKIQSGNHTYQKIKRGNLVLSDEQSEYACLLVNPEVPAVLANSPFGVGKTLMIVAAARLAVEKSRQSMSLQVLTGTTNASVVAMIQTYLNQDKENSARAVRLITEPNRARQMDPLHTEIDFSVLWPNAFLNFLIKTDKELLSVEQVPNTQLVVAAATFLKKHGFLEGVTFKHHQLGQIARKPIIEADNEESPDLFSTFLRIYRPRIVLATSATLVEQFKNGSWSPLVKNVETVQIDEASQTPWYSLLTLASTFPQARFGLIGDHHQLAPHAHVDLPPLCKNVAIGNLLQSAAERNLVPAVNVTSVYRCTRELTLLISKLAYNNTLKPKRESEPEHHLIQGLHLPSKYPVQVLDLRSQSTKAGTSQFNKEEADLVAKLVKNIGALEQGRATKSTIGVLCFYKAQAGLVGTLLEDEPVFVNTIDASQGQEFDVTFVLTSSSTPFSQSPFLGDVNRFVVATTRAKHLCVVLANRQNAEKSTIWRRFIDHLPRGAVNEHRN